MFAKYIEIILLCNKFAAIRMPKPVLLYMAINLPIDQKLLVQDREVNEFTVKSFNEHRLSGKITIKNYEFDITTLLYYVCKENLKYFISQINRNVLDLLTALKYSFKQEDHSVYEIINCNFDFIISNVNGFYLIEFIFYSNDYYQDIMKKKIISYIKDRVCHHNNGEYSNTKMKKYLRTFCNKVEVVYFRNLMKNN